MIRPIALCVALLFASPVQAWSFCDGWLTPPAEHQRPPEVEFEVAEIPADMVPYICNVEWAPASVFAACVEEHGDGKWTIFVREGLESTERGCLMLHERSHIPPNDFRHIDWEDLDQQQSTPVFEDYGRHYAPRKPSPWPR